MIFIQLTINYKIAMLCIRGIISFYLAILEGIEMIRAVIYARVSTDHEDQLNSLQAQQDFFREFIIAEKYELATDAGMLCKRDGSIEFSSGVYADEGLTGTSTKNRKAFNQMMSDAKKGLFNVIITKSVARFGRSVEDTSKAYKDLKELGIGVYFHDIKVNSLDGSKEFIINLFASTAQEESNHKSSIVQFGIRRSQQQGRWTTGNAPYGYDIKDKFLIKNDIESKIVDKIFNLYYYEGHGTGKICRYLNENNILSKRKKKWSQIVISDILKNPIYTGKQVVHKRQHIDVNRRISKAVPEEEHIITIREELRIIPDELFALTQLEKQKRMNMFGQINIQLQKSVNDDGEIELSKKRVLARSNTRHSNSLLYSNVLYCGNCGSALKRKKRRAYKRVDGTKKELGYDWSCAINDMYGKSRCAYRNSIIEENLNAFVIKEINEKKINQKNLQNDLDNYIHTYLDNKDTDKQIEILQNSLTDIQLSIDTNFRLLTKSIIKDEEYQQRNDTLQLEKRIIISKLNKVKSIEQDIIDIKLKYNEFVEFIKNIDINNLTNASLKKIINKIKVTTLSDVFSDYVDNLKSASIVWNILEKSEDQLLEDMIQKDNILYKTEQKIKDSFKNETDNLIH